MNPRRAPRASLFVCLCLAGCGAPRPVNDPAIKAAQHRAVKGHAAVVWQVAFSPDSRWLASSGYDNTIKLYALETRLP